MEPRRFKSPNGNETDSDTISTGEAAFCELLSAENNGKSKRIALVMRIAGKVLTGSNWNLKPTKARLEAGCALLVISHPNKVRGHPSKRQRGSAICCILSNGSASIEKARFCASLLASGYEYENSARHRRCGGCFAGWL